MKFGLRLGVCVRLRCPPEDGVGRVRQESRVLCCVGAWWAPAAYLWCSFHSICMSIVFLTLLWPGVSCAHRILLATSPTSCQAEQRRSRGGGRQLTLEYFMFSAPCLLIDLWACGEKLHLKYKSNFLISALFHIDWRHKAAFDFIEFNCKLKSNSRPGALPAAHALCVL